MEFSTKILRTGISLVSLKIQFYIRKEKKIYDTEAARFLVNHATEEKKMVWKNFNFPKKIFEKSHSFHMLFFS